MFGRGHPGPAAAPEAQRVPAGRFPGRGKSKRRQRVRRDRHPARDVREGAPRPGCCPGGAESPRGLSREQLVSTGGVWEACERAAALPRDNAAAVASALSACLGIVRDALREMEQAQAEGRDPNRDALEDEEEGSVGGGDVSWSEADRQLLGPCVGLAKAAKACLKKSLGAVRAWGRADTAEQVAQLDGLTEAAGDISPSVDELVLSTYPPVNRLTLRLNAGKLAAVLKKMMEVVQASHVCLPSEESWVRFLSGAVDHNMDKIKGLTQGAL
ncbi:PREDICTED: cyclin-D1-binding protein 1 [Gekko japonicus]|uniref:Cyclin-D1-binding protein 1 n=1 Tax=Gekko japonicus TaxID=146911 RepID=A0ABM1JR20_GEKJA|nr:PREDICTED: cyclin-D1-binding protein 1 [Gekko japonicus]